MTTAGHGHFWLQTTQNRLPLSSVLERRFVGLSKTWHLCSSTLAQRKAPGHKHWATSRTFCWQHLLRAELSWAEIVPFGVRMQGRVIAFDFTIMNSTRAPLDPRTVSDLCGSQIPSVLSRSYLFWLPSYCLLFAFLLWSLQPLLPSEGMVLLTAFQTVSHLCCSQVFAPLWRS